ncbi:MAG: helix-turn-helix transcriptional regulator [Luteolibacter sp.]|uniref:helix-turn-helix domain-containing protein n=1 Tax=Luteolibacter sp. TaxID=1962973 RepID=UPI0032665B73
MHRLARAWTLNEFSKLLGVSYQQVQKYEKGTNRIPIDKLVLTAKVEFAAR